MTCIVINDHSANQQLKITSLESQRKELTSLIKTKKLVLYRVQTTLIETRKKGRANNIRFCE